MTKNDIRRELQRASRDLTAKECGIDWWYPRRGGEPERWGMEVFEASGMATNVLTDLLAAGEVDLGEPDFDGSPTYRLLPPAEVAGSI